MAQPTEIPELATELYEMSKEYLRQETVEPMKKLGTYAGFGMGGAVAFAVATVFAMLGVYALMQWVFYEAMGAQSAWWTVLSRGITLAVAAIGAGIIGWRMSKA